MDNGYYNTQPQQSMVEPSQVMPVNFAPAPEPVKKKSHKFIIFIVITVVLIAGIVVAIVLLSSKTKSSEDAEYVVYDSQDESTGGEEVEKPENESLDFLLNYSISSNDIISISSEIHRVLNNHFTKGYNSIYYDIKNVKKTETNELIFTLKTDVDNTEFSVVLKLDDTNHVTSISVVKSDELPTTKNGGA